MAMGIASVKERPSRIGALLYFARTADLLRIGLAIILFFGVGVLNSMLNLFMAEFLAVGPGESLTDAGRRAFVMLGGVLGGSMFAVFTVGSIIALISRHKMMARWKLEYLKAILRQDIGWYDVTRPEKLPGLLAEAIENIDQAFAVNTYLGFQILGMVTSGSIIALVVVPVLGGVCLVFALLLVVPAASLLSSTIENRTRVLADAYGEAGGFVAEVLGAIRTVAALGIEESAVAKYEKALEQAERIAVRTTSRLALATSTMTSFVFYACGTASMVTLALIHTSMRESAIAFAPRQNVSFCVPAACRSAYDTNLLQWWMYVNCSSAVVHGEGAGCGAATEPFIATCLSARGLQTLLDRWRLVPNPTPAAFGHAESTEWDCNGLNFEMLLVAINTIIFAYLQIAQVSPGVNP